MNEKPRILAVVANAQYVVLEPDFDACTLRHTEEFVRAAGIVPFGFAESGRSPVCGYLHKSNEGLTNDDVRKKSFKELIESVLSDGSVRGARYVLFEITLNQDCGTGWQTEGKWQFFV